MLDLLIRGGLVVDGTGSPRRQADVGVKDTRIVSVGGVSEPASQTIDASGLVVAPGFIDVHTHYDAQVLWDPTVSPSALHGVTTVFSGNCGYGLAPVRTADIDYLADLLCRVEGMSRASLDAGIDWSWRSFREYVERVDRSLSINIGFMAGHSAIRRFVMGEAAVGGPGGRGTLYRGTPGMRAASTVSLV